MNEAREYLHGEPWQFDDENHGIDSDPGWGLLDECGTPLGVSVHTYKTYSRVTPQDQWEKATAKAKRIVACVNACAGMEDPEKEVESIIQREARLVEELEWLSVAFSGVMAARGIDVNEWTAYRKVKALLAEAGKGESDALGR